MVNQFTNRCVASFVQLQIEIPLGVQQCLDGVQGLPIHRAMQRRHATLGAAKGWGPPRGRLEALGNGMKRPGKCQRSWPTSGGTTPVGTIVASPIVARCRGMFNHGLLVPWHHFVTAKGCTPGWDVHVDSGYFGSSLVRPPTPPQWRLDARLIHRVHVHLGFDQHLHRGEVALPRKCRCAENVQVDYPTVASHHSYTNPRDRKLG